MSGGMPQKVLYRHASCPPVSIDHRMIDFRTGTHLKKIKQLPIHIRGIQLEIIINNDVDVLSPENGEIPAYLLRESRCVPVPQPDDLLVLNRPRPPPPLFARIQSSIEVADVFHIAKHTFAVLRVHYFHRIAQRNDNLRVRVESLNFLGGISGAKIRSRSFSYSFLISSSGKTAQIIRQSLNSSLIAKNIGREKLGFFDPRHENLGMILEIGVEGSRPA